MPVKISSLKKHPSNPRRIRRDRFQQLRASIEAFPEMMPLRPIIVDENMVILAGHQKVEVLKELGRKEIPDDWIRIESNLTNDQKERFLIQDNTHAGEWNFDILANNWDSKDLGDWGVVIPDLAPPAADRSLSNVKEDKYSPPAKIRTEIKVGDLITVGDHRILCGNSDADPEAVLRLMDGRKAALVFANPPGNFKQRASWGKGSTSEETGAFLSGWIGQLSKISFGFVFSLCSWRAFSVWSELFDAAAPFQLTNAIIWSRGGSSMGDLRKTFATDFEMALVFNRDQEIRGKRLGSVWEIPRHGSRMPIHLPAKAIDATTDAGDIVFDPFAEDGAVMLAAHQLGRRCYAMDLSPTACQIILERMLAHDGRLPVMRNGEPWIVGRPTK